MYFIVIGIDGNDSEALNRRLASRDGHLAKVKDGVEQGVQIIGVPLMDDNKSMNGSVMLYDFPTRDDLDNWLKDEPYIENNVWQDVEILNCDIPPMFKDMIRKDKS